MPKEFETEPRNSHNIEVVAYPQLAPKAIVLDVDNTLYPRNSRYEVHRQEIQQNILEQILQKSPKQIKGRTDAIQEEYNREHKHKRFIPRLTSSEIAIRLGIDRQRWDEERTSLIHPEKYLSPDPHVPKVLNTLTEGYQLILSSNSPSTIVRKILLALGCELPEIDKYNLITSDVVNASKPDPRFYMAIEEIFGISLSSCLSIGDNLINDGEVPVELGMGAVVVGNISQIKPAVDYIYDATTSAKPFSFEEYVETHDFTQRSASIIGVTSRAGSGKTTFAQKLAEAYVSHRKNINVFTVHSDQFFIMGSRERSDWLYDPNISEEERVQRRDQATWWDLSKMIKHITSLKDNDLANEDSALQIKTVTPDYAKAPARHQILIIEGVPLPLLNPLIPFDRIFYLYTHPHVRKQRLFIRDGHKRNSEQLEDRFTITQDFENKIFNRIVFPPHMTRVLNYTDPDNITILPNTIPLR